MGTFFANLLPYIIFVQAAAFFLFMQTIESSFNGDNFMNDLKNQYESTEFSTKVDGKVDEAKKAFEEYQKKFNDYNDDEAVILSKDIIVWPICALVCACFCIALPFRTWIYKCTKNADADEVVTTYKEKAT